MPPGKKRTPAFLLCFPCRAGKQGALARGAESLEEWEGCDVTVPLPQLVLALLTLPCCAGVWDSHSCLPSWHRSPKRCSLSSVLLPLGELSTLPVDSHVELPTYFSLQLLCFAQHMFYLFLLVLLTPSSNQSKQGAPLSVEDAWHS